MKKKTIIIAFIVLVIIVSLFIIALNSINYKQKVKNMQINSRTINISFMNNSIIVETASTEEERAKGLMFLESLDSDKGMIFIYDQEETLSFWMKNTLIPLEIIFLNKDKEIVNIQTMEPCKADPCKTYTSNTRAKFAIEVNAGFAKENNITKGQKASF